MNDYPWLNMPFVNCLYLTEDNIFPNSELPVLIYKNVFKTSIAGSVDIVQQVLRNNGWSNSETGSLYMRHHYHSNTHKAISICSGECILLIGGPNGNVAHLVKGDTLLLPAGAAHKKLKASEDFVCISAYPAGNNFDLNFGNHSEKIPADINIQQVPLPAKDPLYGSNGPLLDYWKKRNELVVQMNNEPAVCGMVV